MFDLTGRMALVTGAGQGMGAGVARLLAGQGAKVAVNDLVEARAKASAEAIAAAGGQALAVTFDVTDPDAVREGVARVEAELGPVDVLVNNAGVPQDMTADLKKFQDSDPAGWAKYVDLNLYGVLHCTKAVLDGMVERGFGRIVTISSAAGQTGIPLGISLYGAGKAGAIGFSRHLAVEVARSGVTVNTVSLGLMDNAGGEDVVKHLAGTVPVGRCGSPDDVGAAVVYLASDEASWVTGQTLGVNGGSYIP
jgi:3-oxoacyl-[acyl-carrier protein] reductase